MLSKNFPFKRETCASALADISTPAVVLFAIVSAAYGSEMYPDEPGEEPWDPVTLWHHLQEDFKVEVSIEAENRINAIRTAIETDLFYLDVEALEAITMAIVHGSVDDAILGESSDVSTVEIMTAIFEIELVRGESHPVYSQGVAAFIAGVMQDDVDSDDSGQDTADSYLVLHKHEVEEWFHRLGVKEEVLAGI